MAQTKGKVQLTEDRNDNAILSDSMLTLSRIAVWLKSFGEEEYLDGITLDHAGFYHKLIESDVLPTTSQIAPIEYEETFRAAV